MEELRLSVEYVKVLNTKAASTFEAARLFTCTDLL